MLMGTTSEEQRAVISESPSQPSQPSEPAGSRPAGPMRRIAIIGSPGSGKSTLAVALGERLELPVIHLDLLFWRPGWLERPPAEWRAMQQEVVSRPSWIIDGNHGKTLDVRLSAADTVLFLDFGRVACMSGIVRRRLRYRNRPRFDRAEGCNERLDLPFVRWVWTFPKRGRPEVLDAIDRYATRANVVRMKSRGEVRRFLAGVTRT
jgi:adenylate kinase family enzyme